ncbi:4'-phosphopantetheinyl transferase family protein [Sinorhizobium americanum]|uniref:4'-phosphopantetheinyl transferase family protein n=1 Tax=Sinorhizobium americanum TaxID=194963 RepID=UPI0007D94946|nr:4'-phosphopantetheinyl transferase superfamily protein [Sinorhizobium americanum]OAP48716.1 hypothetical protein ATC00_23915 [Sinorhizobium americanum]
MRPSLERIGPSTIDIWQWSIAAEATQAEAHLPLLSAVDRARASRFIHAHDRHRFIVGRAGLRLVLSRYLHIPPARIGLAYNAFGKPRIAAAMVPELHFNLSHSADVAMLAVSDHYPVGLDIEEIKPLKEDVATHFFSPRECAELAALPAEHYLAGFYRCWTRKEAFVKAHGAGLSLPLDAFDVTVGATEPPRLERLDGDMDAPSNWSLLELMAPENFHGAVAALTIGNTVRLRYRREDVFQIRTSIAHPAHSGRLPHRNGGSPPIQA